MSTLDEIREASPEGATHYYEWWSDLFDEDCYRYLRVVDGERFEMVQGVWKKTTMYDHCEIEPL